MINKVLYLGPKGSYSELAKNKFSACIFDNACEFISEDSINKIVRELIEVDSENIAAVFPIENSIEGVVRETQDSLLKLSERGFRVLAEVKLSIEHSLIGFGQKENIKSIASHPQALAQCKEFIFKNWVDGIQLEPVLSTSGAVQALQKHDFTRAAIASEYCANLYNVPIVETNINDEDNNTTRFVLLSKLKPQKSSENKISIVFSTENKSGALNSVLNVFEKYGLNMSYIDSRPSRKELGEYVFYVDFSGYIDDANVTQALIEIQPLVKFFAVLSEGAICV